MLKSERVEVEPGVFIDRFERIEGIEPWAYDPQDWYWQTRGDAGFVWIGDPHNYKVGDLVSFSTGNHTMINDSPISTLIDPALKVWAYCARGRCLAGTRPSWT